MTDNEIIKALECCSKNNPDCDNCPYKVFGGFRCREPEADAVALINRQKAELERLQKHNTEMARKHYQDGKAEAVKEFAERLKAKAFTNNYWHEVVFVSEIDNLVKEFAEGEKT